jgi:hypothetical protein
MNKQITTYDGWNNEIERLVGELMKRDDLLHQYATWMETSEEVTKFQGEDIFHRLEGVLQGLSDTQFIPGIGWGNFVAVVGEVQRKTGLDLGVCEHLDDKVREYKKFEYGLEFGSTNDRCGAKKNLIIGSLQSCLPPQRAGCLYRIEKLASKKQ